MRTGKLLWDTPIAGPEGRLQTTAAPLVVKGKVIQGVSGCQGDAFAGGCYIVALDAETGKEAWRFHTIARPGEKGGDSWNGAPTEKRYGGSVWTTPSFDVDTGLLYFGTAQTYNIATLTGPGGSNKPGSKDALHTNSTLAIDPDTGKLAWSYQHFPGDIWDLDWSFEQTVITIAGRKAVVTIGKLGIVEAVDAKTGKYLWSLDLGLQNLVTAIDPKTGRKTYDPSMIPEKGQTKRVCPGALGVRNWLATAADPTSGQLFVPIVESCMNIGMRDTGDGPSGDMLLETLAMSGNGGQHGRVAAIDLATRKVTWTNRRRAPAASAILATAGGLVFEGSLDRWFRALDSASGKVLWQARLDDSPHGFPITYMAGDTQYVAIVTGGGTPHDFIYRSFTPEFRIPARQRTLWVFKLAGK
jgi:alcohol dehydrogenase (cytochrome c)